MTVQQLIDELNKIENKEKEVLIVGEAEEGDLDSGKIVSINQVGVVREFDDVVYATRII